MSDEVEKDVTSVEKHKIIGTLLPFKVDVTTLSLNPSNTRDHDNRSVSEIARSLDEFGQDQVIIFDSNRVVRIGNGRLEAAIHLGWTHIAGIQRDDEEPTMLAREIADNRTAELSTWDSENLARAFEELAHAGIETIGFTHEEMLLATTMPVLEDQLPDASEPEAPPEEFKKFDESIETKYQCPQCKYEWSGKPK